MLKGNKYRYISALIAAAVVAAVCAYYREVFSQESLAELMGRISDCLVVAGVLLAGIGVLSWIKSKGAYDMMSYGIDSLIKPFTSRRKEFEAFYDFKVRKAEERKPWLKEWLAVGLGTLLLALIFLALYYMF